MTIQSLILETYLDTDPVKFLQVINRYSINDIAKFINFFSQSTKFSNLINIISVDLLAECLPKLKPNTVRKIFTELDSDVSSNILSFLKDEKFKNKILNALPEDLSSEITEILSYPDNTAGSIMSNKVFVINENNSVKDVLKKIRKVKTQDLDPIYVLNNENKIKGTIALSELLQNNLITPIKDLDINPTVTIPAMTHKDEIIDLATKAKLTKIPVVNGNNQLIGIITQASLFQTIKEEAASAIQAMAGASRDEQALSNPFFAIRKRLPWLNINLFTVFLAAAVVALFEDTIAKYTALAVLLPVVAGQAGNTGAQALAVVMRGLTLKEIRNKHWLKISIKEILTGAANGLAIGILTSVGVYIWSKSIGLTLVAGISMCLVMAISSVSGAIVPILLRICKQDPAQSSSIILTTITDITAFFTFLWLATFIANIMPLG